MAQDQIEIKDLTSNLSSQAHKLSKLRVLHTARKIYVRASQGHYQKLRFRINVGLFLLFAALPWFSYQEKQAILIDFSTQQFRFFAQSFYPQDLILLACLLIFSAFGLFFITTIFGRVWCGFLCPQTGWSYLFLWFEEKIEGGANKRQQQDRQPMHRALWIKKMLKHSAWLLISLSTAVTFVGYFVPIRHLVDPWAHADLSEWIYFWIGFFTLCTYGNAGWMRTRMCEYFCPYARFQSVMFDAETRIVTYDAKRGEKRGPRRKKMPLETDLGDCIDCHLCVSVCPAAIDIRQGLQYECISCGACIDVCDHTMEKMGYAKGLIRFDSVAQGAEQPRSPLRRKRIGYGAFSIVFFSLFIYLCLNLSPVEFDVLRERNPLYHTKENAQIENIYTLKILNKTQHSMMLKLSATGINGLSWSGQQSFTVKSGQMRILPIRLSVNEEAIPQSITPIRFVLIDFEKNQPLIEIESRFLAPS